MTRRLALVALAAILMTSHWEPVSSHGRLWTPPGRATMWRRGFKTPADYNDNQLFCGGLHHEQKMGYKCGVCGDPYDSKRPHEAGGKYATGTIAATYNKGQEVVLQVELTANHLGWFEFKICPTNDYKKRATQACLDRHPLQLSDGSGTRFQVPASTTGLISIPVKLPKGLTCDLCMLQWRYHGGNNWGTDRNGHGCMGCGETSQEEFYGCADVKISSSAKNSSKKWQVRDVTHDKVSPTTAPFIPPHLDKPKFYKNRKPVHVCKSNAPTPPGSVDWCVENCKTGNCPKSRCKCHVIGLPKN